MGENGSFKGRTYHIDHLLGRTGPLCAPGFDPASTKQFLEESCKILIIGAGGLGCELLKDVALSGFRDIHIIDMDTIDLSNLNRQFLFRKKDVGRPKAEVATEFVQKRVPGVKITHHYKNIKEMPVEFYKQFNLIICGLDSIDARRWINSTVFSFLEHDEDRQVVGGSVIPIIDGGTEGFKGQARVIIPGFTSCFECTLDLFPPKVTFPMCTIAHTPRLPEHCIEWAATIKWPEVHKDVKVDGDNPDHINWILSQAQERAQAHNISGVTYRLTQGVVKNIIPAIASTNAIISAACANEAFKIATSCSGVLSNYLMYMGGEGTYTHTFEYEKRQYCPVCGNQKMTMTVKPETTLEELIEKLGQDPVIQFKKPNLMTMKKNLYANYMASSKSNLPKPLSELISSGEEIVITEAGLPFQVKLNLFFE